MSFRGLIALIFQFYYKHSFLCNFISMHYSNVIFVYLQSAKKIKEKRFMSMKLYLNCYTIRNIVPFSKDKNFVFSKNYYKAKL